MRQREESQFFISIHFLCEHQVIQTTSTCSQERAERGLTGPAAWHSAPSWLDPGGHRGRREHAELNCALKRVPRTENGVRTGDIPETSASPEVVPLTRIPNGPQEAGNCRLQTTLSFSPEGRSEDARSSAPPRRPQLPAAASAPR